MKSMRARFFLFLLILATLNTSAYSELERYLYVAEPGIRNLSLIHI